MNSQPRDELDIYSQPRDELDIWKQMEEMEKEIQNGNGMHHGNTPDDEQM